MELIFFAPSVKKAEEYEFTHKFFILILLNRLCVHPQIKGNFNLNFLSKKKLILGYQVIDSSNDIINLFQIKKFIYKK